MWPVAQPEKFNQRQKRIRDLEWSFVETALAERQGMFLDVGCGTGYALDKAKGLGFEVFGVDPFVGRHGVRGNIASGDRLATALAEAIPFADESVDVVYSSHALEHFNDRNQGLSEMRRVLKPGGVAIILVPSGLMAFISLVSQLTFTTPHRIARCLVKDRTLRGLRRILLPDAHGVMAHTVAEEVWQFSRTRWREQIARYFTIKSIHYPAIYPYPDFPQFFPILRMSGSSSSFMFICEKAV